MTQHPDSNKAQVKEIKDFSQRFCDIYQIPAGIQPRKIEKEYS